MPLTEPRLGEIYTEIVKPTLEGLGLDVTRSDLILAPGPVMETIWSSIFECRLVVAELTGRNPNVYYEVGIADTIGVPVIPITQEGPVFDLRHLRHVMYANSPEGLESLAQGLRGMAESILRNPAHWRRY